MGTSVLSYSGVDIDTITGADQAPGLSNSEASPKNGDWQGESSTSLTPQVAPTYSSTDSDKFLAPTYTSSIDFTPEAPILMYSSSPVLSNFENGHNTIGTIPFYSSDPTDVAIQASDGGAQNKETPLYTSVPDDSQSKGPVGHSDSRHTEALFYNDDVADVKAYWLDQDSGRVCYSVSAMGLRIVYGENDRYWKWSARPGARWPEVAWLREVCWFHVSGEITCKLPAGVYTLSWRLQYEAGSSLRGWDQKPIEFTLSTTDGSQRTISHRYLSNFPNVSDRQWELRDLTQVRLVEDNWFEFDAGEITVSHEEKLTSLQFSMVETESSLWKRGIFLDGVILRPSSITKTTGRYFSVDEIGVDPESAYSPLPTLSDGEGIVSTAEHLVYTSSSDSTPPVLAYSPWPTSTDEQSIVRTTSSIDSTLEAPVLAYSPWPTSTDEQGIERTTSSIDSTHEASMLAYSPWLTSTDEQGIVRTTSSIDSTPEAPVLAYSSQPTSTNEEEIVRTAEPLVYTNSTPEDPMLMYSSSPTLSNVQNGQNNVGTIPIYSSDPTAAIDSMSLVDQDASVPSPVATEHKELSYSLISDSAGTENMEAPFYNSGADDSRSKGPVGQSDSRHTEAPFYTDDDADDVEVPFYTTSWASDAGAQNTEHILATSASSTVSSSNLTNSESFRTSSPQASSSPTDSSISGSHVYSKLTLEYDLGQGNGVWYSVSARGLRIVWGDNDKYWKWSARPGARWPEVACLRGVCWFHVSGEITCKLPAGVYTLSWRLQYEAGSSLRGWDRKPTAFTLATTDGSQRTVRHRYLSNWPNIAQKQKELSDLTPVRLVEDNWFEFDAGEITISDEEKLTSLQFSMVETKNLLWKSGIFLDGVVLRPSSITQTTGRYLSVDEIGESSLLHRQLQC